MFDLLSRLKVHGQANAQMPDDDIGTRRMRDACREAAAEIERLRMLLRITLDSRAPDAIVAAGYIYWPEVVRQAIGAK
jgi:hypothetical protein